MAYAEIYKGIAGFARRFDFELHDTAMEDMKVVGERVFSITRRGQTQAYVTVLIWPGCDIGLRQSVIVEFEKDDVLIRQKLMNLNADEMMRLESRAT